MANTPAKSDKAFILLEQDEFSFWVLNFGPFSEVKCCECYRKIYKSMFRPAVTAMFTKCKTSNI